MKQILLVVLIAFALLLILPFFVVNSRELGMLLFGWYGFIRQNFPQAKVSPAGVATGAVFLLLLVGCIEIFARSLLRSIPRAAEATPRRWRFRWTLSLITTLFLMFAVGYSSIGLARHVGWMINSPGRDYQADLEPNPNVHP
jgi:hypothetical protein